MLDWLYSWNFGIINALWWRTNNQSFKTIFTKVCVQWHYTPLSTPYYGLVAPNTPLSTPYYDLVAPNTPLPTPYYDEINFIRNLEPNCIFSTICRAISFKMTILCPINLKNVKKFAISLFAHFAKSR